MAPSTLTLVLPLVALGLCTPAAALEVAGRALLLPRFAGPRFASDAEGSDASMKKSAPSTPTRKGTHGRRTLTPLRKVADARGTARGRQISASAAEEGRVSEADTAALAVTARSVAPLPEWLEKTYHVVEQGTVPGLVLMAATAISLTLANCGATSAWWLGLWSTQIGPAVAGHHLSVRGWVNEGLMAIFFFVVGLEIKLQFRIGALNSVRKAVLPCIAACGGMVTPMAMYLIVQKLMSWPAGAMAALTVPMATDIAFAMGVLGFFRSVMPASASAFLLTLATVDDLGAILVLATCFAHNVALPFLGGAAAILGVLGVLGRSGLSDLRVFGLGGFGLWWCLLRAGVNSDVAGVLAALCVSTKTYVKSTDGSAPERFANRAIRRIAPFSAFFIMPAFALANTAVRVGGGAAAVVPAATALASTAAARGIAAGLLIGKPLGIVGSTWLADKLGIAAMPEGMKATHLGAVGLLGGIGFTMCLLLTEVALPASMVTVPKLSVLLSSAIAAVVAAASMSRMKPPKPVQD